jgi:hypothetical protein
MDSLTPMAIVPPVVGGTDRQGNLSIRPSAPQEARAGEGKSVTGRARILRLDLESDADAPL